MGEDEKKEPETIVAEPVEEKKPPARRFLSIELLRNGFKIVRDDTASFTEYWGLVTMMKESVDSQRAAGG